MATVGCGTTPPQGWPAPAVVGDTIWVSNRQGKLLAVDRIQGNIRGRYPADPDKRLGTFYSPPLVVGPMLYIGTYEGTVLAFDTGTAGEARTLFSAQGSIVTRPALLGETLVVAASNKLYALNPRTGQPLREPFDAGNDIWAGPVVSRGTVYFATLGHKVFALNGETWAPRWAPFTAQGAFMTEPLVVDNAVYVGAFDSKFYSLDGATGQPRWTQPFTADAWFWSPAVANERAIYVASINGKVYALDHKTGATRWTQPFLAGAPLGSRPVLADNLLLLATEKGRLLAVDSSQGTSRWEYEGGAPAMGAMAVAEGTAYFVDQEQYLHAVRIDSGRRIWRVSLAQ